MTTAAGAAVPTRATPSQEAERFGKPPSGWRRTWFEIIFESQTRAGRTFDLVLLTVIVASVLVVILDSVSAYAAHTIGSSSTTSTVARPSAITVAGAGDSTAAGTMP